MYSAFYGLKQNPFQITPDPDFLFMSPSHKEALESIIDGVEQRKGLIVLTGEVGVGKTTVLHSVLEELEKQNQRVIHLFDGNLSFAALLRIVFRELGLEGWTENVPETVLRLHLGLAQACSLGKNVVLMVDEAQNMPVETLRNLIVLSNLETPREKLLQIVLVGQPDLEETLNREELRELKQHIAVHCKISPLTRKQSEAYIKHRLVRAGMDERARIFSRGGQKGIIKEAKGIPRVLNVLCDNALLRGYAYQKNPVTSKMVRQVIADFAEPRKRFLPRWFAVPAAILSVIAGLFYWAISSRTPFISRVENLEHPSTIEALRKTEEPPFQVNPPGPEQVIRSHVQAKKSQPFLGKEQSKPPKDAQSPMVRVVQEGDNLYRLTLQIYGAADQRLLDWVLAHNPQIKDIERIKAGEKIVFPEPPAKP